MGFKKKSVYNYLLYDTPVDNLFIAEYMKKASGDQIKVYLLALMYAQSGQPLEIPDIAKTLGLPRNEVLSAMKFWENEGVLILSGNDPDEPETEFVNLREIAFGGVPQNVRESKSKAEADAILRDLFDRIESVTASLLDPKQMEELADWVNSYGMSTDFIVAGYEYCRERKKSLNSKYVGRILKDWRTNGITTPAKIQEYIEETDRRWDYYRRVFRALGFSRNPSEEERRLMDDWTDRLQFTEDRILEACAKTAGIDKPNIKYVNTVLENWYKEAHTNAEKQAAGGASELIRDVIAMYAEDKAKNEAETKRVQAEILKKAPQIRKIDEQIRNASFNTARAMFMGERGKAVIEGERLHVRQLNSEKEIILKELGYPPDAMDMRYTCKKCRDTGELPDGSRCSCFAEKLALAQIRRSGDKI